MKKPINKMAVALVLLAVLVLGSELYVFVSTYHRLDAPVLINFLGNFWQLIRSGVVSAAQLIAFATIIELLDRIRWAALKPEDRAAELARPSVWHIARRWPHSTPG